MLESNLQEEDNSLKRGLVTKARLMNIVDELENDSGFMSPDSLKTLIKINVKQFG